MTKFKIHNTYGNKKEVFIPNNPNHVKVYACGPTVYDHAHIGNARMAVVCDQLIRVLKEIYPKVTYVSNITDIDDKIIEAAKENNIPVEELTMKFSKIYNEDMLVLGVQIPDIQPRATQHIDEMIKLISNLIKNEYAYYTNAHVLFSVKKYSNYGKLSGRTPEEQIAGSRVKVVEFKEDPADFVLWKPSEDDQPGWESPWGRGRPGWHIECSAMSEKTLGLPFDIHGGGQDLIFPHHENEIAQTCGAHKLTRPQDYAKYWLHNGFVTVEGEKMSKSLGNIKLVNNLTKAIPGEVVRFALLSAHYRQPLDWSESIIKQSKNTLDRYYRFLYETKDQETSEKVFETSSNKVLDALCDDLNTSLALAELSKILDNKNKEAKSKIKSQLLYAGRILGILGESPSKWLGYEYQDEKFDVSLIDKLIQDRIKARSNKDFTLADTIRIELNKMGIEIEDTQQGTKWRKK
tara:strand:- start:121 stop:1506 length:1386 start_codon:yes stop_codon:yes gene_type:complete